MGLLPQENEDELLRSVAIQNAQSIFLARQRAEQELVAAKEALEARTVELERANELVRTIAENAASGLLMLDENGTATYVNPAAVEQTGYTLEELGNAPFHDLLHARAGEGGHRLEECPLRNARTGMQPLKNHRDLFVRKDGVAFPVSCSLSPLQRDGRPAGAVLEFRDITDEVLAQTTLQDANRRKDQFLATLSHELRTPMTSILGWVQFLRSGGYTQEELEEALGTIESSARLQARLIDDMLDVSRIVLGKFQVDLRPTRMADVIDAALTTARPAAVERQVKLTSDVGERESVVNADPNRMQQVIGNLLSNAIKFTPPGRTVDLRLEKVADDIRISVTDEGEGIEETFLPYVFERLRQSEASTNRSGLGLGLAIARHIVELHHGDIVAESRGRGQGARFVVRLPILHQQDGGGKPKRTVPMQIGV